MHHLMAKDHRKLSDFLSKLNTKAFNGQSQGDMFKCINDFIRLVEEHFEKEEKVMNNIDYPQMLEHIKEHARLLDQLKTMKNQLNKGQTPFGDECMSWLKDWFYQHMTHADKKLDDFLLEHMDNEKVL